MLKFGRKPFPTVDRYPLPSLPPPHSGNQVTSRVLTRYHNLPMMTPIHSRSRPPVQSFGNYEIRIQSLNTPLSYVSSQTAVPIFYSNVFVLVFSFEPIYHCTNTIFKSSISIHNYSCIMD